MSKNRRLAAARALAEGFPGGLQLKPSGTHGLGLFSTRPIARGKPIYRIRGERVSLEYDDDFGMGPDWISLGWQQWLDPDLKNPLTFTNHACQPNAIISKRLTVIALRRIGPDEEIFLDYSTTELDPLWQMPCGCASAKCRKKIVSFPQLPARLQRAYEKHLCKTFLRGARKTQRF